VPSALLGNFTITSVDSDLGARTLGNRREHYQSRYGDDSKAMAKNPWEQHRRSQEVTAEAIKDTLAAEGLQAREEALRTLEGILPGDYAALATAAGARGGALVKLGNDGAVRVTALASLRVGKPKEWYRISYGPRFDQSLFRAGLLDMVRSGGSPPPPG
jgi:hypothetical protein